MFVNSLLKHVAKRAGGKGEGDKRKEIEDRGAMGRGWW
jgi:hypothetical protein